MRIRGSSEGITRPRSISATACRTRRRNSPTCRSCAQAGISRRPTSRLARSARGDGPMHASHCGLGVQRGAVDRMGLCRMFNRATRGHTPPTYLSSDHDRLYQFHQWQANLSILGVEEIKTVPYAPLSHPFFERINGSIRRECLDHTLFWTAADLEMKLLEFQSYYNGHRAHAGLEGRTPEPSPTAGGARASVGSYRWQPHCRGLYQTPMAA